MRKQLVYGAASVMIAVAAVTSFSGCSSPPDTAGASATPAPTMGMDASWAEGYNNLADLKAHSAIAVQGSFTRVIAQSSIKTIPITDFEFTVDKVLNDPGHLVTAGAKLTVRQTGGTVDGVLHQTTDDPLFKISENAVLFLKQPEPGLFYVVGGPTGRFEIVNGKVSPAARDGAKFAGSPADFAAAVKNS
ncbi:hypothetical protein [Arthrobacter sp. Hiyo1]|uniref:hypothetical protein n=1 Tax=Arthrobacter sp. Hiyo1 TaxID=1588020 RepID=UPI0007508EC6|nr:hypothetical protein [Arthrobacter sp. Hiyo1]